MGLLRSSDCLEWEEIVQIKENIKIKGINQFINVYKHAHSTFKHEFIWGDEIELIICNDEFNRKLMVTATNIINNFFDREMDLNVEFASYMVEMTPYKPHDSKLSALMGIEQSMIYRINKLAEVLQINGSKPLLMTLFPKLGRYKSFEKEVFYNITKSEYFPDEAITEHKRFYSFVSNIIKRRGRTIEGYIPIMQTQPINAKVKDVKNECIKIDSMGQGMGCCCLQVTLQASTMSEARTLYDMIGSLCPLLLRLTRATPMAQGKLLSTETRWDMLVFSVDCRTDEERGCKFNVSGEKQENKGKVPKSRYSSIDMYISQEEANLPYYNDINPPLYQEGYDILLKNNVDELMARHIASLFIRDPILVYKSEEESHEEVVFSRSANHGEESEIEHKNCPIFYTDDFENIQSSNWRSMRFKLPAQNGHESEKGWKIEVRPMEILPTAFENASWCVFVVLLSRSIVEFKANFYIPLSLVDENFRRANLLYNAQSDYHGIIPKDRAIFYYRTNFYSSGKAVISEGTIEEIFLGTSTYEGIFSMVEKYVKKQNCMDQMKHHLDYVKKRLSGELLSVSDFIRKFVIRHESYRNDSDVPENIIDDLIAEIMKITEINDSDYLLNVV